MSRARGGGAATGATEDAQLSGVLHNLMDLFARDTSPVYIDWHHLTADGNRKVAEAMLPLLLADERRQVAGTD